MSPVAGAANPTSSSLQKQLVHSAGTFSRAPNPVQSSRSRLAEPEPKATELPRKEARSLALHSRAEKTFLATSAQPCPSRHLNQPNQVRVVPASRSRLLFLVAAVILNLPGSPSTGDRRQGDDWLLLGACQWGWVGERVRCLLTRHTWLVVFRSHRQ